MTSSVREITNNDLKVLEADLLLLLEELQKLDLKNGLEYEFDNNIGWVDIFKATTDFWRVFKKDEEVVAYWNCFIFNDETQKLVESGCLVEVDIQFENLKKDIYEGTNQLYFETLCIDKNHRSKKVYKSVLKSVYQAFNAAILKGIRIDKIWTTGWTREGEKLLKKLGFCFHRKSRNFGNIYFIDFETFMQNLECWVFELC
ncbi:MAG: hypothetical protein FWD89_01685 [Firmicutes bacterium]|nr:hypothetical protein [Bacillota bacterium]MCL2771002.1 hypothetical protein [Bacillota bacterium]